MLCDFFVMRRRAGQKCGRGYEGRKNWELLLQGTLAGKDSNFGGKVLRGPCWPKISFYVFLHDRERPGAWGYGILNRSPFSNERKVFIAVAALQQQEIERLHQPQRWEKLKDHHLQHQGCAAAYQWHSASCWLCLLR